MGTRKLILSLSLLVAGGSILLAEPTVETVLEGLKNPVAVALQPETGVIFVAEGGAGRVVRVMEGQAQEVIGGFPVEQYGDGPKFAIGPLGLAFLDKDHLVVGGGGQADGEELLRVYKLPAEGSIKAGEMVSSSRLGPLNDVGGEGNFYGLARIGGLLYVTCNGDDTKGWIARAVIAGGDEKTLGPLQRAIATKVATGLDAPVALAVAPDGSLVVGQMGEIKVAGDSGLSFYHPSSGKLLAHFATGLHDITGLAYGPDGMLYATDFSWLEPGQGSLSQLLSVRGRKQTVRARMVLPLERPTAITFTSEGTALVTVLGSGNKQAGGKLLRITLGP
jgi:hypothetical protein